ncbi:hypothetical protein C9374_014082 [Naegleria lovaniensis]|uniref:Actin n=1 Tax=Naegleria lovaniensis TaxID=51637 RepID=A0AA88GYP1_NAELO|nr:uncharacterized protein C9374_014082 [Naegleria lovaniensis]KAG2389522.1 hypothetical protein C9374_014082 [Naegleria lovaniensis]
MPYSDNVLGDSDSTDSQYDLPPPIVIDFGSGVFKAGLAGEEIPSCCFQNVVGLPHLEDEREIVERYRKLHMKRLRRLGKTSIVTEEATEEGQQDKTKQLTEDDDYLDEDYIVGDKALESRHSHTLFYPMEKGRVVDWEQMEFLIEYALLDVLDVELQETLILITENPMMTKSEKEKLAECLFEVFEIAGLCFMPQPLLSLYSVGKTTGLVIDSGDCITHTVPVYEGYIIDYAMRHLDFGGRDVTHYLQRLLYGKGYRFASSSEHHFVREIKESMAYVASDYEKELTKPIASIQQNYELPDGQVIKLDEELFSCTELLFKPYLVGKEAPGLADLVFDTFKNCPIDVRREYYSSIILSGGNTLLNGFQERTKIELENNEKSFKPFRVIADPMRQFGAWMGGSVIASLPSFENVVVTFEDWDDYGTKSLYLKDKSFAIH